MAFYAIAAASGGYLNYDNGYKGLQISTDGFLSFSRELNLIYFDQPAWCRTVGVTRAIDCGTGTQIKLEWGHALPSDKERVLVYNIYYSTNRFNVFLEGPKLITDKTSVVINGLTPGDMLFVAVRATDFPPVFSVTDFTQVGQDLYLAPGDRGNEECNLNIGMVTPYYDQQHEPAGGRNVPLSSVVAPSDGQDSKINFRGYAFCGYHRTNPADFFTGKCIGSYAGGSQTVQDANGNLVNLVGLNLEERNSQRLELLLIQTGEPVVLLRRKYSGRKCPCETSRAQSTKTRCPDCFGTTFFGGYTQYISPRRPDGRLLIRVTPATDDVTRHMTRALEQAHEPEAWTLPAPAVGDRDVIIRFDPTDPNKEVWRYEILHSTQNRAILGNVFGSQKFTMKRMDRSDVIYGVSYVLP